MPTAVLLAGPNGAGKTTFINRFLKRRAETFFYVNPDEVARGLPGAGPARDLTAGRLVLERLETLFNDRPTSSLKRRWRPGHTPTAFGCGAPPAIALS